MKLAALRVCYSCRHRIPEVSPYMATNRGPMCISCWVRTAAIVGDAWLRRQLRARRITPKGAR